MVAKLPPLYTVTVSSPCIGAYTAVVTKPGRASPLHVATRPDWDRAVSAAIAGAGIVEDMETNEYYHVSPRTGKRVRVCLEVAVA